MGRPIAYSAKEIETMQKRADYLLETAEEALADIPAREEAGFKRWVSKEARGPTLVVFAWNVSLSFLISNLNRYSNNEQFPYLIIVNALIPALLAGNSVILKPSHRRLSSARPSLTSSPKPACLRMFYKSFKAAAPRP